MNHTLPVLSDGSLNLQAFFDAAYAKIMEQGRPSINGNGYCQYNGPDGLHCAIGHFVDVPPQLENKSVRFLLEDFFHEDDLSFMEYIQVAHDSAAAFAASFIRQFRTEMLAIATHYGLAHPASIGDRP